MALFFGLVVAHLFDLVVAQASQLLQRTVLLKHPLPLEQLVLLQERLQVALLSGAFGGEDAFGIVAGVVSDSGEVLEIVDCFLN